MALKLAWVVRQAEGGMIAHLRQLLQGLNRETLGGEELQLLLISPKSVHNALRTVGTLQFFAADIGIRTSPRKRWNLFWRLRSLLQRQTPDIVHFHGMAALAMGLLPARMAGCNRLLLTAHNIPLPSRRFSSAPPSLLAYGHKLLLRPTRKVIGVSQAVIHGLQSFTSGSKLELIYNGVDCNQFRPSPLSAGPGLVRRIGMVARLIESKGVVTLLKAASIVHGIIPECQFYIAGDGPGREHYQSFSRALGLDKCVHFLGYCPDMPKQLRSWDLFVLPTENEAFSMSILEAMACGLPVVASNLDSVREAISPGRGGLLVQPADAPSLAAALLQCIKNPEQNAAMGQYNRERVQRQFTAASMVQSTKSVYEKMVRY